MSTDKVYAKTYQNGWVARKTLIVDSQHLLTSNNNGNTQARLEHQQRLQWHTSKF